LQKTMFLKPKTVEKWAVISMINPQGLSDSVESLVKKMQSTGLIIAPPDMTDAFWGYKQDRIQRKLKEYKEKKMDFVLVILERKDKEVYRQVKDFADRQCGILTVFIQKKSLNATDSILAANVGVKINTKLRGVNHTVQSKATTEINLSETMVVGYDVTHPSPEDKDTDVSIAGLVASVDKDLSQWPGYLRNQDGGGKEMVTKVGEMLEKAMEKWKQKNLGKDLKNIIIYRDGVSEGQDQLVLTAELTKIRQVCQDAKVTLVVAVKRHHSRFVVKRGNKYENPESGLVVHNGITEDSN